MPHHKKQLYTPSAFVEAAILIIIYLVVPSNEYHVK